MRELTSLVVWQLFCWLPSAQEGFIESCAQSSGVPEYWLRRELSSIPPRKWTAGSTISALVEKWVAL